MRGTCHTALNPKRCLKAPREAKLIAVYIYISLPMLGQLCKRAAHSEFPGKHNSPELFSSSTECLCSPRGLSAGSKMSFLGQACKYLLSSSGKCRVTPPHASHFCVTFFYRPSCRVSQSFFLELTMEEQQGMVPPPFAEKQDFSQELGNPVIVDGEISSCLRLYIFLSI